MKIYIPTFGRAAVEQQKTYALFSNAAECEIIAASKISMPKGLPGRVIQTPHIGAARAAIANLAREQGVLRYAVADDDLKLFKRTAESTYAAATDKQVAAFLKALSVNLDRFAHGGVQQRFMAHTSQRHGILNKRYIKLAAYNTELMKEEPKFRLRVHEDVDAQLQLARAGHPSFLMTEWAIDDHGQYKDGGCQRYRTPEVEAAEFRKLQKFHPAYVSFKNGRSRVAWKRAYEDGSSKL
jgi:hypothetical protein